MATPTPANSILGILGHREATSRAQPLPLPGVPARPSPKDPTHTLWGCQGWRWPSPAPRGDRGSDEKQEGGSDTYEAPSDPKTRSHVGSLGKPLQGLQRLRGTLSCLIRLNPSSTPAAAGRGPRERGAAALELHTSLTSRWGSEPKNPAEGFPRCFSHSFPDRELCGPG